MHLDAIEHDRVMENDLREGCVVAVRRTDPGPEVGEWDDWEVVYPPDFTDEFAPWARRE